MCVFDEYIWAHVPWCLCGASSSHLSPFAVMWALGIELSCQASLGGVLLQMLPPVLSTHLLTAAFSPCFLVQDPQSRRSDAQKGKNRHCSLFLTAGVFHNGVSCWHLHLLIGSRKFHFQLFKALILKFYRNVHIN